MKRNGKTVNALAFKVGSRMARWATSGMNWAPSAHRDAVIAAGLTLLAAGPLVLSGLGKTFLAAEAADGYCVVSRSRGHYSHCWWQSGASQIIIDTASAV
jgi:hypothetical protein